MKRLRVAVTLFGPTLLIGALLLATSAMTCSLTAKEKVSRGHLTVHAALIAADDYERQICVPNPTATNLCTSPLKIITDAQHQAFSRLLVQAYDADIRIGRAIIAWQPGMPVPTDVASLKDFTMQALAIANALAPSPQMTTFTANVNAILVAINDIMLAFASKLPVAVQ